MQNLSFSKEVALAIYLFSIPFLIHIHVYFPETPMYCLISRVEVFGHFGLAVWAMLIYLNIFLLTLLFFKLRRNLIRIASIPLLILSASFAIDYMIPISGKYYELNYVLILITLLVLIILRKQLFNREGMPSIKSQFLSKYLIYLFPIVCYTIFFIWVMLFLTVGTNQVQFFFWTVEDMGFPDAAGFLFYLNNKLGIILMCLLCFFSTKKWWRYALLSPAFLNLYEAIGAFNPDQRFLDEYEIIMALPVLLLLASFLYLLFNSKRLQAMGKGLYEATWKGAEAKLLANNKKEELISSIKSRLEDSRIKNADLSLTDLLDLKHKLEKEVG